MAVILDPFQNIIAVEGLFGAIRLVRGPTLAPAYWPNNPNCQIALLVPAFNTPDRLDGGYTQVDIQLFVGEFWKDHSNNPFAPSLSISPEIPAGLYEKTATHVPSGDTMVPSEFGSKVCEQLTLDTDKSARFSGAGTTYIPSGIFSPFEMISYRGFDIGLTGEIWIIQMWAQTHTDWPTVPSVKWLDIATVNDKVTFA